MGKVQHFEIPADDVGRAKAFYGDVFGWGFEDWGDGIVGVDPAGDDGETGVIGGDIYQREARETPTIVVTVDSIDEALAAVAAAGGMPLGDIELFGDEGRYAYFADPEGNRIGLWDTKKP